MAQIDITPASNPVLGLHVHVANGQSANVIANPTDNPAPAKSGTQISAKISQANGGPRFANPSWCTKKGSFFESLFRSHPHHHQRSIPMTEFEERELDELIQVRLFLRDN